MYKCECGYKSVKHMGQCPMCKEWGAFIEVVEPAKKYSIPRVSAKKKREIDAKKNDDSLEQWFIERRKEMKGYCQCGCGAKSSRDDDKFYKFSIAHILQKRHFKTVSTHPLNFVEMAFWGGCHSRMDDRSSLLWVNMACWDEILQKFLTMLPLIDDKERKYIPEVFTPYI